MEYIEGLTLAKRRSSLHQRPEERMRDVFKGTGNTEESLYRGVCIFSVRYVATSLAERVAKRHGCRKCEKRFELAFVENRIKTQLGEE